MPPSSRPARVRRTRSFRERVRLTLHSRGSAEAIARGVALGLFIALTPLFGLHLPIVWLVALLLRANRTASFLAVFVTNVVTFVPIFAFTYAVGVQILPGRFNPEVRSLLHDLAERMRARPFFAFTDNFQDLVLSLKDLFWPMMAGGIIVGAIAAALAYPLTRRLVIRVRDRRKQWLAHHPNALKGRRLRPEPADGPDGPAPG
jgi:uncharacterized protein (DUF2062 family)